MRAPIKRVEEREKRKKKKIPPSYERIVSAPREKSAFQPTFAKNSKVLPGLFQSSTWLGTVVEKISPLLSTLERVSI